MVGAATREKTAAHQRQREHNMRGVSAKLDRSLCTQGKLNFHKCRCIFLLLFLTTDSLICPFICLAHTYNTNAHSAEVARACWPIVSALSPIYDLICAAALESGRNRLYTTWIQHFVDAVRRPQHTNSRRIRTVSHLRRIGTKETISPRTVAVAFGFCFTFAHLLHYAHDFFFIHVRPLVGITANEARPFTGHMPCIVAVRQTACLAAECKSREP